MAWPSSDYANYNWLFFFFMGNLVAHDVVASLIYFCSIYTYFFFINLEDICVYVMEGNTQVLDEELNLLLVGFFGIVFLMVLLVL